MTERSEGLGVKVMATTKLLFDTFRYTVIRRNDGSLEIARKNDPRGTRIFHKRAKRMRSSWSRLTIATASTVSTGFADYY
jgi:hypothetical protein